MSNSAPPSACPAQLDCSSHVSSTFSMPSSVWLFRSHWFHLQYVWLILIVEVTRASPSTWPTLSQVIVQLILLSSWKYLITCQVFCTKNDVSCTCSSNSMCLVRMSSAKKERLTLHATIYARRTMWISKN
jgi:hypothetical protein